MTVDQLVVQDVVHEVVVLHDVVMVVFLLAGAVVTQVVVQDVGAVVSQDLLPMIMSLLLI